MEYVPAIIPLDPMSWKKYPDGRRRTAGVNSFGITGTDAHAIIEELHEMGLVSDLERPHHLLRISAKTEKTLDELLKKNIENIEGSQKEIADIAYTDNIGRAIFSWRAVITGKCREELVQKIRKDEIPKEKRPQRILKDLVIHWKEEVLNG